MDQHRLDAAQMPIVAAIYCHIRLLLDRLLARVCGGFGAISGWLLGTDPTAIIPISVNYFPTRECNYKCGFCFHTSITSFVLPIEEAKRGLKLLQEAGMRKLNFSGGEPFIHQRGNYLGELMKYAKAQLRLESVTVISNGSLITEAWMKKYARYVDMLAVSCDSFQRSSNEAIGRFQNARTDHVAQVERVRDWCVEYGVIFKMNTVVNAVNWQEDMTEQLLRLKPARWKVFQCLVIEGENAGEDALRQADAFVVTDEQFQTFLRRHACLGDVLVPESNASMRDSYLLLDEYMRFLDCTRNRKDPSRSILDVGVAGALKYSGFDEEEFIRRGGVYNWSKPQPSPMDW
ncbi:hypothetical protein V9T40_006186 [Parthenolecanium corni]|uniref:S-adenosylmethionine-dependent nucleotide dehydratase RSAD2 n=1 Tax=Parthenolecanium corni TaxID=536013 RepID=A0AAN9YBM5_9HEMI